MTVQALIESQVFTLINKGDTLQREITAPFCCDLLSIAMGKAPSGCGWVTVMGNVNTLAVAALTDTACVILAEGITPEDAVVKKAKEQSITVFQTEMSVFEAALTLYQMLHD
ncbi:MAG: DRTGG domain-containing protein [Clostridiales bacterium]|nr:DRTGG domain-containing protein [Clostridiales bacterium]